MTTSIHDAYDIKGHIPCLWSNILLYQQVPKYTPLQVLQERVEVF